MTMDRLFNHFTRVFIIYSISMNIRRFLTII